MGIERLSEPLQLTDSAKVADNAVNIPSPSNVGIGIEKFEP